MVQMVYRSFCLLLMGALAFGKIKKIDKPVVFQRLDPHGEKANKGIYEQNGCTVCHAKEAKGWVVKDGSNNSCFMCHNKVPHSGVTEHIGKTFMGSQISCLSCHSPHRWNAIVHKLNSNFQVASRFDLKEGDHFQPNFDHSMLRRDCVECHKW